MRRPALIASCLGIGALGLVGWIGSGPKRFVANLRSAAEARDPAAIFALSDSVALQAHLRQALQARVAAQMAAHLAAGKGQNKEALADALADAAVAPMAEGLSQPEGLAWLLHSAQAPEAAWASLQEQRRGLTQSAGSIQPTTWALVGKVGQSWQVDVQGDTLSPALHLLVSKAGWGSWRVSGIDF